MAAEEPLCPGSQEGLLERYRLRVFSPPCDPASETVNAIVSFDEDLTELLPYLNAVLGPAIYSQDPPYLRVLRGGRVVTFHPHEIAISKLTDDRAAEQEFLKLRRLIRRTARRAGAGEIEPCFESIGEVKALDVFKLLPRTNCGRCGRPTCMAFAVAVAMGKAGPEDCPLLVEADQAEARRRLLRLTGLAPPNHQS